MRTPLLMLPFLAVAALAAEQDFTWRGAVAAGQTLEVKGVNGNIRASAATGSQVEIHAVKRGRKNNPEEVTVEVIPHNGGITVCAVYPTPAGKAPNECKPGDAGRMNVSNNDVSVAFEVRLPAGVKLIAKTVNGGIEASGLSGDVVAKTVNGRIEVAGSRNVEASTVNGGITASMGETNWTGERKFSTVNGSISVELPDSASTEIHATTVNGGIHSDHALIVKGKISSRSLNATLGSGGRSLTLSTVNGSVNLNRRRS